MPLTWEAVQEKQALPELIKKQGITNLVLYAAGSGDFNPLHYNPNSEEAKLVGAVVVHGRFKWAAMGELVSNWLGHKGRVKSISCRYGGMDYPDKKITCKGIVERKWEEDGKKMAALQLWTENEEGAKTANGTAVVIFN